MMSRGSTGRMMPKPIESTSTATKTNTKAPWPALRKLMRGLSLRGLPAEQQHRGGSGAQRALPQVHQIRCHGGDGSALEEPPPHESPHVGEPVGGREQLEPTRACARR